MTNEQLILIEGLGQIAAGLISSLRGLGENNKADAIENTLKADENWRRAMANDPQAPLSAPPTPVD